MKKLCSILLCFFLLSFSFPMLLTGCSQQSSSQNTQLHNDKAFAVDYPSFYSSFTKTLQENGAYVSEVDVNNGASNDSIKKIIVRFPKGNEMTISCLVHNSNNNIENINISGLTTEFFQLYIQEVLKSLNSYTTDAEFEQLISDLNINSEDSIDSKTTNFNGYEFIFSRQNGSESLNIKVA